MAYSGTPTSTPGKLAFEETKLYVEGRFNPVHFIGKLAVYLCGPTKAEWDRHAKRYLDMGFPLDYQILVENDARIFASVQEYYAEHYPGVTVLNDNIIDVAEYFRDIIAFLDLDGTAPIINNNYRERTFLEREVVDPKIAYVVAVCSSRNGNRGKGRQWWEATAEHLRMPLVYRQIASKWKWRIPEQRFVLQAHLQSLAAPGVVVDCHSYGGVKRTPMMAIVLDNTRALQD